MKYLNMLELQEAVMHKQSHQRTNPN